MPSSACQKCARSEEHTSELQSHSHLVCRLLLEKTNNSVERDRPERTAENTAGYVALTCALSPGRLALQLSPPTLLVRRAASLAFFFFFKDRPPTESSPLPPPDPFPI